MSSLRVNQLRAQIRDLKKERDNHQLAKFLSSSPTVMKDKEKIIRELDSKIRKLERELAGMIKSKKS
jgi:hypothetical protein